MENTNVVQIKNYTREAKSRKRDKLNQGKDGRVFSRNRKLWVDFYYLGERVRESTGAQDTPANRTKVRHDLNQIEAEIARGTFVFADVFPKSKKKEHFTRLEGRTVTIKPDEVTFKEYYRKWWEVMKPGMSRSQIKDYTTILKTHHMPYFGDMTFDEICNPVAMKKFVAHLKGKKTRKGTALSPKRIQNVMIPLRIIVRDAVNEHNWRELPDPFNRLKLPKVPKSPICPFNPDEWATLMRFIKPWYRPYFEVAVLTGMRPSEQVALKWDAVDDRFIHVRLSRVSNQEKTELKTESSNRLIEIRPSIQKWLDRQMDMMRRFNSPYVFLNTQRRPILQDKMRELWERAIKKSGLKYRKMYVTRHTFASWALGAGETPAWVARTLGHVDTSMVYKKYGRYIPNFTHQDGSALERKLAEARK